MLKDHYHETPVKTKKERREKNQCYDVLWANGSIFYLVDKSRRFGNQSEISSNVLSSPYDLLS